MQTHSYVLMGLIKIFFFANYNQTIMRENNICDSIEESYSFGKCFNDI